MISSNLKWQLGIIFHEYMYSNSLFKMQTQSTSGHFIYLCVSGALVVFLETRRFFKDQLLQLLLGKVIQLHGEGKGLLCNRLHRHTHTHPLETCRLMNCFLQIKPYKHSYCVETESLLCWVFTPIAVLWCPANITKISKTSLASILIPYWLYWLKEKLKCRTLEKF